MSPIAGSAWRTRKDRYDVGCRGHPTQAASRSRRSAVMVVRSSADRVDDRGGAVDLRDADLLTGLHDGELVDRPGRPDLTLQLDPSGVGGDALEHQSALADQVLWAVLQGRSGVQPAYDGGADEPQ